MSVIVPGFAHRSDSDGSVFIKSGRVPERGHALVYVHENEDGTKTVEIPKRTQELLAELLPAASAAE